MIIDNTYRKFRMIIMHKSMIPFCWKIYLSIDEDMLKLLQPYGFDVGQSERGTVLKGLDLGVQGMRVGGQVRMRSFWPWNTSLNAPWENSPSCIPSCDKKLITCLAFLWFSSSFEAYHTTCSNFLQRDVVSIVIHETQREKEEKIIYHNIIMTLTLNRANDFLQ